jgi:hypothetical protein
MPIRSIGTPAIKRIKEATKMSIARLARETLQSLASGSWYTAGRRSADTDSRSRMEAGSAMEMAPMLIPRLLFVEDGKALHLHIPGLIEDAL